MKFKRDFILYSNPNKPPPKFKSTDNELKSVFERIPNEDLIIMPQIRKAFQPEKKIYLTGIKKEGKPEYIKLDDHMSENDIKIFTKINDMKEQVYEIDNADEDNEDIIEENEKFSKNYQKLKKEKNKFHRGTYLDYEPFLNISSKYIAKNMKVPNLSEDHNLFNANPLILQGSELENFIVYNLGDKNKGVQFLNRLDEYLEKKISGNTKMSIIEMERLEKLKKEEKPKGYIPPEIEITMLKNDIDNTQNSYKNLAELEEFFKPKKIFSLKKNNSSFNIFNNSIDRSPVNNLRRKLAKNLSSENLIHNNSVVSATTSIGVTRKSSPKEPNNNKFFYPGLNLPREFQFKLPKLETPIRSPSGIFGKNEQYNKKNKMKIRKISFNNSLKIDSNFLSRNNEISPIFNSININSKELNNRLHKIGKKNKMYKLLKLSNHSKNDNSKKEFFSTESEVDEIFELNKEIESKKESIISKEESKDKKSEDEETKNQKKENENFINIEERENNKDNNRRKSIVSNNNKKAKKAKIEKLRIVNKENDKNNNINENKRGLLDSIMPKINSNKSTKFNEKENKSLDTIKLDPNEIRYQKIENLFNIVKENTYNNLEKETKKDIESYLGSRGKNLKKMMTTKGTYFSLHNLMRKAKEKNIILEEYMIRNRFNVRVPFSTKQKIVLDKNEGFVKEIIKQENKFNDIIFKDKK